MNVVVNSVVASSQLMVPPNATASGPLCAPRLVESFDIVNDQVVNRTAMLQLAVSLERDQLADGAAVFVGRVLGLPEAFTQAASTSEVLDDLKALVTDLRRHYQAEGRDLRFEQEDGFVSLSSLTFIYVDATPA